jgi:hypothetical protein
MARLKGWKFVLAVLLGAVLPAIMSFSIIQIEIPHRPTDTYWSLYIFPHLFAFLLPLALAIPVLATSILLRPGRPQRLAAWLALPVGLGVWLAPDMPVMWRTVLVFWHEPFPKLFINLPLVTVFIIWIRIIPFIVSCWVAAMYWRAPDWQSFWRGPGGAIVRGGVMAALISFPFYVVSQWYFYAHVYPQLLAHYRYLDPLRLDALTATMPVWQWVPHILASGITAIAIGAIFSAMLVAWKPKPALGAFAGIGIALGILAIMDLPRRFTSPVSNIATLVIIAAAFSWFRYILLGLIAGIYAGKWTEAAQDNDA